MRSIKVFDTVDQLINAYFKQDIDATDLCIDLLNHFNVRVCRITSNRVDTYDIDDHEFGVYTSDDSTDEELARLSQDLSQSLNHEYLQTSLRALAKEAADDISMWDLNTDECLFRLEVVKAVYHPDE